MKTHKLSGIKNRLDPEEVIWDYRLAYQSRQVSIIGRREVLSGKAKFGIFGDGKEVAQIALAKVFRPGDFRSGYYRDQTLMFAIGELTFSQFFAQLFADPDVEHEPASAGRSMNGHFATRSLNPDGSWKNLLNIKNSSADVSPTGSQMPRLVGLAYASRLYRELDGLKDKTNFSLNGDEIAFGTIGNASAAEGMFWEAVNAIGVLQSPAIISIWDDGYGISVPNKHQLVGDLSQLLSGFSRDVNGNQGYNLFRVPGWDYQGLIEVYKLAESDARKKHIPAIIHVIEMTQPQGHSTSGSHERYKTPERLAWEEEHDCLKLFREWIIRNDYIPEKDLEKFEQKDREKIETIRKNAWDNYKMPIHTELDNLIKEIRTAEKELSRFHEIAQLVSSAEHNPNPMRKDIVELANTILLLTRDYEFGNKKNIISIKEGVERIGLGLYDSHLSSESKFNACLIDGVPPVYSDKSPVLNGFEILNRAFDAMFSREPLLIAFGEDLGKIGGVNQGFAGLQDKYGDLRISDTGIREITIIGQAIGLAMRGFRPIAEIQYLDYLLYALQIMSDDLATVQWRTAGGQKAPVIIRTRGHRLEGVWHSGSPLAGIIHFLRGINVIVPRNMVQAAGFYNTLLESDEPGLVVEVLNGYRLKEMLPDNIAQFRLPLGLPEVIKTGEDITIVTYGASCRIALEAAELLTKVDISVEIVDVQTLLPFDLKGVILESLRKTNRVLFLDEDVPGGTTAYMMQEVLEKQEGHFFLDSMPRTLSASEHRPAYGTDGNYFSKPNVETVFERVYEMMNEVDPQNHPIYYR